MGYLGFYLFLIIVQQEISINKCINDISLFIFISTSTQNILMFSLNHLDVSL